MLPCKGNSRQSGLVAGDRIFSRLVADVGEGQPLAGWQKADAADRDYAAIDLPSERNKPDLWNARSVGRVRREFGKIGRSRRLQDDAAHEASRYGNSPRATA